MTQLLPIGAWRTWGCLWTCVADSGVELMEPVSAALLLALAGGVGGAAAQDVWAMLRRLVQRPFGQAVGTATPAALSSGAA